MFKKEKVKKLHYVVNGVIESEELQKIADSILLDYGKEAKIDGFRKGHVPVEVLRQKYNNLALGDAMDKAMNLDLSNFLKEKKLRLASAPKANVDKWSQNENLEYTMEFDILPELPSFDLSKFKLVKDKITVNTSDIDKTLEDIRQNKSTEEKENTEYKAKNGDVVIIDFKGFINGVAFEGGESKKYRLILGSKSFIDNFEDQIIGHKAGDKFDVNVRFPKDYHSKNLANKDTKFEVEIHEIYSRKMPELNDDFAKSIGYDSIEKLKTYIKEILEKQQNAVSQQKLRDSLLDLLNENIKLELPESLVEQEYKLAEEQHKNHHCDCEHEHSECKCKFDEKQERKEAEKKVKLGLILAEWGKVNNIDVTRDELQQALFEEASRYPNQKEVFEYYNKNKGALSMLRGILFEKKVLDEMLKQTNIKE